MKGRTVLASIVYAAALVLYDKDLRAKLRELRRAIF